MSDKSSDNKDAVSYSKDDPYLLTPGPLTTSSSVKKAMLHDYGSRDERFIELNGRICARLLEIAHAGETHVCVPLQGSGTFAVEAMLATMIPVEGKLLNLVNGAYGHRISEICDYLGREYLVHESAENVAIDLASLEKTLVDDKHITHVSIVYCETTSGILNPLEEIAEIVYKHGRALLVDAMSAFGALPVDARKLHFSALAASSNKCLQGVPGMGFCLINSHTLEQCKGNAKSLSLDLYEQALAFRKNGQWRFTPPVHCMLALSQALLELQEEGGVEGRLERYQENCNVLKEGMRALGFRTYLADELQAPIIVTFITPSDNRFSFELFYRLIAEKGFLIYPGKITKADTFRIGCIGDLDADLMRAAIQAIEASLSELGISNS
ncbi:MAG: 2-aminoethylphosphonate--pyruvate transaminase [Gammaproteobacteria bacterium]|nr:2-aminoethylphosphonate--pyruvate transaminase [Gammaproteobacteria bacterium]